MPASSWHLMQDGVLFLTYNQQGGSRGGKEIGSQNWWMGMAAHPFAKGQLRFNRHVEPGPLDRRPATGTGKFSRPAKHSTTSPSSIGSIPMIS